MGGLIAGAGIGAAAAAALRQRWKRSGGDSTDSVPDGSTSSIAGRSFLDHLAEAVRIPTVADGDHDEVFSRFRAFLATTYPRVHDELEREIIEGHSLLFTWPGSDPTADPVLLMAHQDVVPVEPGTEDDWEQPPFSGELADGYLWGRGTVDDKASLIGIFEAVESLLIEGFQPSATVYLAFGHDEEVDGTGAARTAAVLGDRGVRLRFVLDEGGFVTDGLLPGATTPIGLVGIGEKSSVNLVVRATEEGGHSSMPPPRSAIGKLATAITAIEDHPMPARVDVQHAFFAAVGPAISGAKGMVLSRPGRFRGTIERRFAATPATDALIRTTAAVTMVDGGVKENVLPQEATAIVNVRIMPGDTAEAVRDHFRAVVGDTATVEFHENDWIAGDPLPTSDPTAPDYIAIADLVRDTFPGTTVAPWILTGATDSRHFAPIADNVYRFVPVALDEDELAGIHGTGERMAIDGADAAVSFYRRLITTTLGG